MGNDYITSNILPIQIINFAILQNQDVSNFRSTVLPTPVLRIYKRQVDFAVRIGFIVSDIKAFKSIACRIGKVNDDGTNITELGGAQTFFLDAGTKPGQAISTDFGWYVYEEALRHGTETLNDLTSFDDIVISLTLTQKDAGSKKDEQVSTQLINTRIGVTNEWQPA